MVTTSKSSERSVCKSITWTQHFHSAPNLSKDIMLINTGLKLELLQDIDQLLFFENGSRGGINGLGALHYFDAYNKYLENFNPNEDSTFGALFEVTSLNAGQCKKKCLLTVINVDTEITLWEIIPTHADSTIGYYVEVVLAYPTGIHDVNNDLLLAPEN